MTDRIRAVFERAGYGEVYTPALEYETTFARANSAARGPAYRVFDELGNVLVLRSDMTIPIARMVATRYRDAEPPLRFSYFAHAYRERSPPARSVARIPPGRDRADRGDRAGGDGGGPDRPVRGPRRGGPRDVPDRPGRRLALLRRCSTASASTPSAARASSPSWPTAISSACERRSMRSVWAPKMPSSCSGSRSAEAALRCSSRCPARSRAPPRGCAPYMPG